MGAEDRISTNQDDITSLLANNVAMKATIKELAVKVDDLENRSRRSNLRQDCSKLRGIRSSFLMSSVEHLFLQSLHLLAILEKILSTHPVDAGMLRMCLVIDNMFGREASLSILQLRIIRAGQHPVYSPVNAAINLTWEVDFGNHPLTDIHLNYRIDFRHHLASVIYFFRRADFRNHLTTTPGCQMTQVHHEALLPPGEILLLVLVFLHFPATTFCPPDIAAIVGGAGRGARVKVQQGAKVEVQIREPG
ncbi:unnamed protein product [Gadus morhua 'NCC']